LNEYISGAVKAIGDELVTVNNFYSVYCIWTLRYFAAFQGNVDKVVVVIKDKDQVALERFIFSVQNMIEVESYNKDTRLTDSPCVFLLLFLKFSVWLVFRKLCPLSPLGNIFEPSLSN
jgi:mitotic spindle assembly checkpoint protein MAD2B